MVLVIIQPDTSIWQCVTAVSDWGFEITFSQICDLVCRINNFQGLLVIELVPNTTFSFHEILDNNIVMVLQ